MAEIPGAGEVTLDGDNEERMVNQAPVVNPDVVNVPAAGSTPVVTAPEVQPITPTVPVTSQPTIPGADDVDAWTNVYRTQIQNDRSAQDSALQAVLTRAASGDPESAATRRVLSEQLGVPEAAITSDPDRFRTMLAQRRAMQEANAVSDPILRRQLTDPDFAQLAHDDIFNLNATTRLLNWSEAAWNDFDQFGQGGMQVEIGRLKNLQMLGSITEAQAQRLRDLEAQFAEVGEADTWFGENLKVLGQQWEMLPEAAVYGAEASLATMTAAAILGQAGPQAALPEELVTVPVAGIGAFIMGTKMHMSMQTWQIESGESYAAMIEQGVEHDVAKYAANGVGMVNAALEYWGLSIVAAPFKQALVRATTESIASVLQRATMRSVTTNFAKYYAATYGAEVAQELMQEVSAIAGEELAKAFSENELESLLATPEGREQIGDRLARTLEITMQAMILVGGIGPGANAVVEIRSARRAQQDVDFFNNLAEQADSSRVRSRSTSAYQQFIQEQTQGGPQETIYMDAEQVVQVFNQNGLELTEVDKVIPGFSEQIQEAAANGGDVQIKTSEFAAKLAGTEIGTQLQPHMRTNQDGVSAFEAAGILDQQKQLIADAAAEIDAQNADNKAFNDSASAVRTQVLEQIKQTGVYNDKVARNYADFVRNFVVTQAAQLNMMPEEFYAEYMYKVQSQRQEQAATSAQLFNQEDGSVRLESPQFIEFFGDSVLVDDQGAPLRVYHGTADDITEFDLDNPNRKDSGWLGTGVYLTDNPKMGELYANQKVRSMGPKGQRIMPLYARLQNPYMATAEDKARVKAGGRAAADQFTADLQAQGYDGVIYQAAPDAREIVVFEPSSVKSEFNSGTWSRETSNILAQNELNRVANWTEARLKFLMSEYAYSGDGKRTKGMAVRISPQQFLDLTASAQYQETLEAETGPLDQQKLSENTQTPFIEISFNEDGTATVRGHEGRHRMIALRNAGFDQVSVVLRLPQGMDMDIIESLDLAPQEFWEGEAGVSGTTVNNAIPIAWDFYQDLKDMQSDGDMFFQRGKEQAKGKPIPTAIEMLTSLEGAFDLAGSQSFNTNRELKVALQERARAAAKEAKVDLAEWTAGTEEYYVRMGIQDALTALETNPNAIGWYNEKVTKALRLVSLIHPEIATDPYAKFAFTWALAVTSNGLKVDKNFELAEVAYRYYKENGVMPTNIQAGQAQIAINESLRMFNDLVARDGIDAVMEFMTTKQTVKQVQEYTGKNVSGENLTTEVYGAAALGPKIGNGFFANLYGHFEQLTMDRWFMRTWGRWSGTLIEENKAQVKAQKDKLKALIKAMSPAGKKAFEKIIGMKLQVGKLEEVALAIQKASMKPANRVEMAKVMAGENMTVLDEILGAAKKNAKRVSIGDELRKAGNALSKYLDGQKEAPSGPPERNRIRQVMNKVLIQLQQEYNDLTMSDLQALLWYPEKRLYDSAKADEQATGYEDNDAPDYANAAAALAAELGVPAETIQSTIQEVDNELSVSAVERPAGAQRGARDRLLNQRNRYDERTGLELNEDGTVTVYHHTSGRNADVIRRTGQLVSAGEPDVYVTTRAETDTGYGDTAVPIRVRPEQLILDDEFPNGRQDYRINVGRPGGSIKVDIGESPEQLAQGERGGFDPKRLTTILNEKADYSTFLHETGHFFLTVYSDMAARPDATEQMKADMQTLLDWFGVESLDAWNAMSLDQQRKYHESFAYNFEIYLFEGKAPSVQMQTLFDRFAAFLKSVYRSIRDELNTLYRQETGEDLPILTGEVRQVMDRMIASEEQIEMAQEVRGMKPMFQTQEQSGMDDATWAEYQAMMEQATQDAVTDLTQATLRQMKWLQNARAKYIKQIQREADGKRKDTAAAVSVEVQNLPVYRAIEFFKRGMLDGQPVDNAVKLSIVEIEEMYGKGEMLDSIKKKFGFGKYGILGKDNGIHPDQAAEILGFSSGYAMVQEMLNARPMKEEIALRTDKRMLEENGEYQDPVALERKVEEALHNEARARFIAAELRFVAKINTPVRVMRAAAKQAAQQMLAGKKLGDLKVRDFTTAERRAAKAAIKAQKEGRSGDVIKYKQNQLMQNMLAVEAMAIREEYEKAIATFKKLFKADKKMSKSMNMDLIDAARSIVSYYGVGPKGKAPGEFVEKLRAYNPELYADLEPMILDASRANSTMKDLTVEDFRGLRDAIEGLIYRARRDRQMMIEGRTVEMDEIVKELNTRLEEIGIPDVVPGETEAASTRQKAARQLLHMKAATRRVESWADATDGPSGPGAFTRYIWRPVRSALDMYRTERNYYVKKFSDSLAQIKLPVGKIEGRELGYTFGNANGGIGKAEVLGAMLHMGNESNLRKLLLGRGWGTLLDDGTLDTSRWDAFVQRMFAEKIITKADMDWIQSVWDLNEELKPKAQKAHREIFGYYFKEVESNPVVTPVGTYKGGYVPAAVDPFLVRDAERNAKMEQIESDFRNAMPSTGMGFTKGRVEYNKPLSLDVRLMAKHIDDVIRFANVQPAISDVLRLIRRREFADTLTRMDPTAIENMLLPWLNRAARQQTMEPGMVKAIDKFWSGVRNRTGISIMFANLTNALQQFTGLFVAALKVDGKQLRKSLMRYTGSPMKTSEAVAQLSPFMADRMENQIFDIQETMNDLLLNPNKFQKVQKWSTKHGYFIQQAFQNMVDVVAWTAKYNQVLENPPAGMNQEQLQKEAIAQADAVVRLTQDSLAAEDIAAFQVGSPFYKTLIQFSGYFNMLANTNSSEYIKVIRDLGFKGNKGKLVYIYTMGFMLPMVMSDAIVRTLGGQWDDEDDDGYLDEVAEWFFGSQFRGAIALIPAFGPGGAAVFNAFNDKPYDDRMATSPSISMLEASTVGVVKAGINVVDPDREVTGKNVRDVLTLISLATGIPVAVLGRPIGYAMDVERGRIDPENPIDYTRGLITGKASEASR